MWTDIYKDAKGTNHWYTIRLDPPNVSDSDIWKVLMDHSVRGGETTVHLPHTSGHHPFVRADAAV